jgi:broad specificity phosphatase PhoE
MKIGLVRHFKVDYKSYSHFYYPEGFRTAMQEYDEAEIILGQTDLNGTDWQICFSSSYKRAIEAAKSIFMNEIIETNLLREVSLQPFTLRKFKLPWFIWHVGARIAWSKNSKSQDETKQETNERIKLIYSKILESERQNILVVSHGFFMKCFSTFLRKNGFKGEIDPFPQNGRLYIFEKNNGAK